MPRQPGTGDRTRRAVIRYMYNVQAYSDEKIAELLSCSVQTVRRHVANKLCDDLGEDEHYLKEWKRARNAKVNDALADRPRPSSSKPASTRSVRALSRRKLISTKGAASMTVDHDPQSRWTSITHKLMPHAPLKFQSSSLHPDEGNPSPARQGDEGGQEDKTSNQPVVPTVPSIVPLPVAQAVQSSRPRHFTAIPPLRTGPRLSGLGSVSTDSIFTRHTQAIRPTLEEVHPEVVRYVEGLGLPAEPYARHLARIGLKNGALLQATRNSVSDGDLDRLEEELRRSGGLELAECLVLMAGLRKRL